MPSQNISELPYFLQSFENLMGHFDAYFPDGSTARGDQFLALAKAIIPVTDFGQRFPAPTVSEKKSHDGGVDLLTAENEIGERLYAQSKYKLPTRDDFDSVISKFHDFETRLLSPEPQQVMFSETTKGRAKPVFLVITASKLEGIINSFLASNVPSRAVYDRLKAENRIAEIDGPQILTLLQGLYRQAHLLPTDVELTSTSGWITQGNVRLGTVGGGDLVELYRRHGGALFFENIRDFLGLTSGKKVEDRVTVNTQIVRTIVEEPQKMLERNNGITFRAQTIETDADNRLKLHRAAIVNGCQTTMCLVSCGAKSADCLVQVKIVVTEDAWDIATAANYQNPVARIELDLARYLRPQLVQKAATDLGYGMGNKEPSSAAAILDSIYRSRVDYEEMKLLYLGLFSRKPNNLFEGNYTELRTDVLESMYDEGANEDSIFRTLFAFLTNSRTALKQCNDTFSGEEYASLFKRFFAEEKPRYRVYLAVLAACGALRRNIADRDPDTGKEAARTLAFLEELEKLVNKDLPLFHRTYLLAFQAMADTALDIPGEGSEADVAQHMFRKVSQTAFDRLYQKLLLRVDGDKAMPAPVVKPPA